MTLHRKTDRVPYSGYIGDQSETMERRLAAIMAADVVGFSRLVELDEYVTLETLKTHRLELLDGKIAEHRGRIVKLMGDGMLVEFPSSFRAW
jgi:adenylate cyclase